MSKGDVTNSSTPSYSSNYCSSASSTDCAEKAFDTLSRLFDSSKDRSDYHRVGEGTWAFYILPQRVQHVH